jgi:hypothetical protein
LQILSCSFLSSFLSAAFKAGRALTYAYIRAYNPVVPVYAPFYISLLYRGVSSSTSASAGDKA